MAWRPGYIDVQLAGHDHSRVPNLFLIKRNKQPLGYDLLYADAIEAARCMSVRVSHGMPIAIAL